jgi:voltage-gated potassium channel
MPHPRKNRTLRAYLSRLFEVLISPQVLFIVITGNAIMFSAAAAFFYFEKAVNPDVTHFFDAVWWAFCTVSTVGFGDIVPVTTAGRLAGIVLIITGICFFVGFGSAIFSASFQTVSDEIEREEKLTKKEFQEVMAEIRAFRQDWEKQKSELKEKT